MARELKLLMDSAAGMTTSQLDDLRAHVKVSSSLSAVLYMIITDVRLNAMYLMVDGEQIKPVGDFLWSRALHFVSVSVSTCWLGDRNAICPIQNVCFLYNNNNHFMALWDYPREPVPKETFTHSHLS